MIFLAAPDVLTGRRNRNNSTTTLEEMKKFFSSGEMLVGDDSSEEEVEQNRSETKEVKMRENDFKEKWEMALKYRCSLSKENIKQS
jgi:hypothetical protein